MVKQNIRALFFFLCSFIFVCIPETDIKEVLAAKLDTEKSSAPKKPEQLFKFDYTDTPLVDILQEWAALLNKNLLLPQGAQTITAKVTYKKEKPLSMAEGQDLLMKVLDMTGFTVKHHDDMIMVIKTESKDRQRQALDTFINTPLAKIPSNEQVINYIYYLDNLTVQVHGANLKAMLDQMLSKNAHILTDEFSNAIILTDKSNNIQAVMKIIIELDQGGLRNAIEVIPLHYVAATLIESLFAQLMPQAKGDSGGEKSAAGSPVPFFPKNTKVVAIPSQNSIVIMGTSRGINVVKEFIFKYIDHPVKSGRSVLHTYDLQYLDANEFADKLMNIVRSQGGEKSQSEGKAKGSESKQYFKDVIVVPEHPKVGDVRKLEALAGGPTIELAKGLNKLEETKGSQIGGNKLIIAARHEDWLRIKKLIQELDKPQLQVALEVLIIDITAIRTRALGSQMRNTRGFNNSTLGDLNFQSAEIVSPILKDQIGNPLVYPPDALAANLLKFTNTDNTLNLANSSPAGSLIISFEDKSMGVWNVWRILNQYATSTVLAQPFLITKNNEKASVSAATVKLLKGDTRSSTVSAATRNNEDVAAATIVEILPLVSKNGNINLSVTVQTDEFIPGTDNRITRIVQTNSNVANGEILALGGLTKNVDSVTQRQVPLLANVPLVGWFFKDKSKTITKTNLLILIHPTVSQPYTAGGMNAFTAEKVDVAKCDISESLTFDNLRDPITRLFFEPDFTTAEDTVGGYIRKTDEIRGYSKEDRRTPSREMVAHNDANALKLKDLIKDEANPLIAKNIQQEVIFNS